MHVPFNFPKKSFYKVDHQVMGREAGTTFQSGVPEFTIGL
jgi:hypothetical protein